MADRDRQFLISLNNGFDRSVVLTFLHEAINGRGYWQRRAEETLETEWYTYREQAARDERERSRIDLEPDDRPLVARAMRAKTLEHSKPIVQ